MTADEMKKLEALASKRIGPAWARIVKWLREKNKLATITARIKRGDIEGAVNGIADAAAQFAQEVRGAHTVASQKTAEWLGKKADKLVSYDESNSTAVRMAQELTLELQGKVTADQKATIMAAITTGLAKGENPYTIAKDIRNSIGLTPYQQGIVNNFRRALEDGDWANAKNRELIDGRWIKTFDKLAKDGGKLPQAKIDEMVAKYSDNWVGFRAETIARHQALRAAHAGYDNAIKQAIAKGTVEKDEFERKWNHKKHGQQWREFHASMNGQVVGIDEPFISGLGNKLMYPGDPSAPLEETLNCTCVVSTRFKPKPKTKPVEATPVAPKVVEPPKEEKPKNPKPKKPSGSHASEAAPAVVVAPTPPPPPVVAVEPPKFKPLPDEPPKWLMEMRASQGSLGIEPDIAAMVVDEALKEEYGVGVADAAAAWELPPEWVVEPIKPAPPPEPPKPVVVPKPTAKPVASQFKPVPAHIPDWVLDFTSMGHDPKLIAAKLEEIYGKPIEELASHWGTTVEGMKLKKPDPKPVPKPIAPTPAPVVPKKPLPDKMPTWVKDMLDNGMEEDAAEDVSSVYGVDISTAMDHWHKPKAPTPAPAASKPKPPPGITDHDIKMLVGDEPPPWAKKLIAAGDTDGLIREIEQAYEGWDVGFILDNWDVDLSTLPAATPKPVVTGKPPLPTTMPGWVKDYLNEDDFDSLEEDLQEKHGLTPEQAYEAWFKKPPVNAGPSSTKVEPKKWDRYEFRFHRAQYVKTLPFNEKSAAEIYSGSDYQDINNGLRSDTIPREYKKTVADLDALLDKASVQEDMLLFRGAEATSFTNKIFGSLKPGDVISDKAYMSTSATVPFPGEYQFIITAPRGAKAAAIPSVNAHEDEFLLPRATRLRVDRISKGKDRHGIPATLIYCTVVV